MIYEERLFKIINIPLTSEKVSFVMEKTNTIVLEVIKEATKTEIKSAVQKLFKVDVKNINTLLLKGKIKHHGQHIIRLNNKKKAYITLKKGQNINLINSVD